MSSTAIQGLITALEGMAGPELVSLWSTSLKPALQAEVAKANTDLQVLGNALIAMLDAVITAEAPKI